jgi:hypothetical protein
MVLQNLPHRSNDTPYRPENRRKTDTFRPCAPRSPAVSIHTRAKANRSLMKQELNAERVRILNRTAALKVQVLPNLAFIRNT